MAVGDVYELAAYHRTADQQNQVNVTHWRVENIAGTGLGLQQIADDLSGLWGGIIQLYIPATTTYQGCKFRRVFPNPTNVIQTEQGNTAGSLVGDPLPSNVSMLISKRSYTAPVFVRGRTFLPSPDETENDATGAPGAAYRTSVKAAFDALYTIDQVLGSLPDQITVRNGIYRRNHSPVFYPTDYCLYRRFWTSQRRRRPISRPDISVF